MRSSNRKLIIGLTLLLVTFSLGVFTSVSATGTPATLLSKYGTVRVIATNTYSKSPPLLFYVNVNATAGPIYIMQIQVIKLVAGNSITFVAVNPDGLGLIGVPGAPTIVPSFTTFGEAISLLPSVAVSSFFVIPDPIGGSGNKVFVANAGTKTHVSVVFEMEDGNGSDTITVAVTAFAPGSMTVTLT